MITKDCFVVSRQISGGLPYPIKAFSTNEEAFLYKKEMQAKDKADYTIHHIDMVSTI
jgi:hypothetical protein